MSPSKLRFWVSRVREWEQALLGQLVSEVIDRRGVTPRKLGSSFVFQGHRVISAKTLRNGRVDLTADDARFVDDDTFRRWMRTPLAADDVLLTSEAPLGEVAYLVEPVDWCLGQRLFALRTDKDRLMGRFLYYMLRSDQIRHALASRATGTTAQGIRQSELRQVPIRVPDLRTQREIASVLGCLDDKVDLNRRMNETLDTLAIALFARTLEDAWRSRTREDPLGDHLEVVRGLSYGGAGLGTGLPMHNLNSIREGGGYKRDGIKHYSGEFRERHTVRFGDVIVANTEQGHDNRLIGYPAIVPRRFGEIGLFSHHLYRVRPKGGSPLTPTFIYLLLRSEPLRSTVAAYANGTTVNMLPADALARPTFPLPPREQIRALDEQVSPLLAKIEANEDESETLAALRDALLPKLISGELRLPDAEAIVATT